VGEISVDSVISKKINSQEEDIENKENPALPALNNGKTNGGVVYEI
jgi:hypothetical protein